MNYDPAWERRPVSPLNLRRLLMTSGLTSQYPEAGSGGPVGLLYLGTALCGEAGETAGQLKKVLRDDGGVLTEDRRARIVHELGDTFWYWLRICAETGADPYQVIAAVFRQNTARLAENLVSGDDTEDGVRVATPSPESPGERLSWREQVAAARPVSQDTVDLCGDVPGLIEEARPWRL